MMLQTTQPACGPWKSLARSIPTSSSSLTSLARLGAALLVSWLLVTPGRAEEPPLPDPRYVDVTEASGVRFVHDTGAFGEKWMPETLGPGVVIFDADGDDRLDLFFVNGRSFPDKPGEASLPALYRNRGNLTFEDVTKQADLDVSAYCLGAAAADVDRDGDDDLLMTCLGTDRLLRNDKGRFTDVSTEAGLSGEYALPGDAAFFDADRDGDLDLLVARYVEWTPETDQPCFRGEDRRAYCTPEKYPGASPVFYRNLGNGVFEDETRRSGFFQPDAKGLGVTVLDIDNDDWLDVVVACDTAPNLLFHNRGRGVFREIAVSAGLAVDAQGNARGGMGVDAADYDRSGRASLVISYFYNESLGLHRNVGDGLFLDDAKSAGVAQATLEALGWGTFFFDYDLDGWLDLLVANGHLDDTAEAVNPRALYAQPTQLFRNREGRRFQDVTEGHGFDLAQPRVARGAAHGDLDGDGDLDVVLTTNGGPARVFENRGTSHGHWLRVSLESTRQTSPPGGLGARVEVESGGAVQHRRVGGGGSYLSQSQVEPTFGLGDAAKVDRVTVHWPSGATQTVTDVSADQVLRLREPRAEEPEPRPGDDPQDDHGG